MVHLSTSGLWAVSLQNFSVEEFSFRPRVPYNRYVQLFVVVLGNVIWLAFLVNNFEKDRKKTIKIFFNGV